MKKENLKTKQTRIIEQTADVLNLTVVIKLCNYKICCQLIRQCFTNQGNYD